MTRRTEVIATYVLLLALLATTVALALVDLGPAVNTAVGLGVGALKALLIALAFMEVRRGDRVTPVFACAGFFWLGILLMLAMGDYVSRGWLATGQ